MYNNHQFSCSSNIFCVAIGSKIKELLQLLGKCDVEGDIFASKLQIEPTARFNGSCHTGASVVGLNKELGNVVNK
jgi:cytoskeletal protein CcmA (bactofilin family)